MPNLQKRSNFHKIYTLSCIILCFIFASTLLQANAFPSVRAVPDYAIVIKNNTVIFDVLENDNITGIVKEVGIVDKPQFGQLTINEDYSFSYEPYKELCEEVDLIRYFILDETGYDTVDVTIEILCEPITIFSGFSPDSETGYTTFTILGIENYPENTLYVFDSDGNEILNEEGYQNDWNGKVEGVLLPKEKIYYYVFNNGEGNYFSGYVRIN